MVTGLMTKAEKVAAGGLFFQVFCPPNLVLFQFLTFIFYVKRNEKHYLKSSRGTLTLSCGRAGKGLEFFPVLSLKNMDLYCFLFLITI